MNVNLLTKGFFKKKVKTAKVSVSTKQLKQ